MRYMKIILDKGKCLNPCFPKCGMFVSWKELNGRNPSTVMFTRGKKRKRRYPREEDMQAGVEVAVIQSYRRPLST